MNEWTNWLVIDDERLPEVYFFNPNALECVFVNHHDYRYRVGLATKGGSKYFTGTFPTIQDAAKVARRIVEVLSMGPLGAKVSITKDGEVKVENLHA